VHTIGMGTPAGGPLPVKRGGQVIGFKEDQQGRTVVSQLNEDMLRQIAAAGGGSYQRATVARTGIDVIMDELQQMDRAEIGTFRATAHEDHYQIPLLAACLLIFACVLSSDRRRQWGWKIKPSMLKASA
jgi:Ca-activated chloride channel homolog